ncbi:hypothetical protein BRC81_10115 [Halobacteriales archaeon QS_1_68_20]|nr:MAG: hypothetical protein BRC81_10115 [Halobacteriales archaeon QS_1_68_20]
MSARRAAALASLLVLAGCLGGNELVTATGSPASVQGEAVAEAGYERAGSAELTVEQTLTVTLQADVEGRESVDVNATVPVERYRRTTADGPAVLAVASSPSVTVIENPPKSRDPLGERSTAGLVTLLQSTYEDPTDLSSTSSRPVETLDREAELVTYRGTAIRDGERVDVAVHVLTVEHEDNVVTAVAIHPAGVDERDRIAKLLAALDH